MSLEYINVKFANKLSIEIILNNNLQLCHWGSISDGFGLLACTTLKKSSNMTRYEQIHVLLAFFYLFLEIISGTYPNHQSVT